MVEIRGLEPLASALRTRRYTSLAISPYSVRCQWRLKTRFTAKNTIHQRHQKINNFFAIIASVSLDIFGWLRYNNKARKIAPLAQLDRAFGYGPEGRGFESLRARHVGAKSAPRKIPVRISEPGFFVPLPYSSFSAKRHASRG